MKTRWLVVAVLAALALQPALAEEGDDLGWGDTADFSFVLTAGNSETQTLAFNNKLTRKWSKALFTFKLGGLKAENTTRLGVRNAVGGLDIEETTSDTAENYYATLSYDRNITERLFWYAAGGWLKNEFAGIKNRYTISGGVGNIWRDKEDLKFRTNYGVSYTDQTDVVEVPGIDNSFVGALVGWNYLNGFGKATTYTNDFIFNYNLEESSDWRWVMDQALTVSMTEMLALKVSLAWLYNNDPAFELFTLPDDGDPVTPETFLVQLDELDTIFGISLVVNF